MIDSILRRFAGRDGIQASSRQPPTSVREQQIKTQHAERAASEARKAVDDFTAAVERAMRGTNGRAV